MGINNFIRRNYFSGANILRIVLALLLAAFAAMSCKNYMYRACVSMVLPEIAYMSNEKQQQVSPGTEFKIMQSDSTIERALHRIINTRSTREVGIDNAAMTGRIKKGLDYRFDSAARVFELHYYDQSRDMASKTANAVAESYVENYVSNINAISGSTLQNLYSKQVAYKKELADVNVRYEKFCSSEKIVNIENEMSVLSAQFAQYNNELSKLQAEIALYEKLAAKNIYIKNDREKTVAVEPPYPSSENETVRDLRKKVQESEVKLAVLKRKYTEAHPVVKNETAMLEILRKKLNASCAAAAEKKETPQPAKAVQPKTREKDTKGDFQLELLYAKKNTFTQLIANCEDAIKAYPKKKLLIKSYEVEISKIEDLLTRINKQIEDTILFQARSIDNVPKVLDLSRKAELNIPYGYLAGACLTVIVFFMSFRLEKKVMALEENRRLQRIKDTVTDGFKLKVLGSLNKFENLNFDDNSFSPKCFAYHQKESRQSKTIGAIRSNIVSAGEKGFMKNVFGVTSLEPGDGKTVIAANLGISSAQAGQSTLVIDMNYKTTQEAIGDLYRIDKSFGVTDIVIGETPYGEVTSQTALENLKAITTGTLPQNAARAISSPACEKMISEAAMEFSTLIVDCPAFSISNDFSAVSRQVKNLALVIDVERVKDMETFEEELGAFAEYVKNANIELSGVILNEK